MDLIHLFFLKGPAVPCSHSFMPIPHLSAVHMLFSVGHRSDVRLFQNNWDQSDCWHTSDDFTPESKCWTRSYFFSRHFSWGDEFSLYCSWGHWSGSI